MMYSEHSLTYLFADNVPKREKSLPRAAYLQDHLYLPSHATQKEKKELLDSSPHKGKTIHVEPDVSHFSSFITPLISLSLVLQDG